MEIALVHPVAQTGMEIALVHPVAQTGIEIALVHPVAQTGIEIALVHFWVHVQKQCINTQRRDVSGISMCTVQKATIVLSKVVPEVAAQIALAARDQFVDDKKFTEKIKTIKFNLQRNHELRQNVLTLSVTPLALVLMDSSEMCTEEKKEKKRKRIEHELVMSSVSKQYKEAQETLANGLENYRSTQKSNFVYVG